MKTKRSQEGYLMLDNRNSPGISEEALQRIAPETPMAYRKGLFEAPTYTCSHCCRVVVMNPLRTRAREYCSGCDHYICDQCGARRKANGGECKTFNQIIEEIQERAVRQEQSGSSIILST